MTVSSTRTSRADDYPAAVRELTSRGRFGISLGLERIGAILDELDHPERQLHGALVAGTNGKGSVVAMVQSVLRAAGLRVGTMPKPHLVSYRERIAIDGMPMDEADVAPPRVQRSGVLSQHRLLGEALGWTTRRIRGKPNKSATRGNKPR